MSEQVNKPSSSGVTDYFNIEAFRELFSLSDDEANKFDVIEEVRQNVPFRGTNLWILIFAVVICSVGLNVNSTAVIIGAMLISPLMGPIVGLGVGSGTYDMKLIRRSLRNLIIAVVISVSASALYFFISPLSEAQSELLARTAPNLWDVIIALFGGLSGIIAGTRKEKSNVVPGVAIATALMPPLCTAGYGLATLNDTFFFGALYLFFINTVFISFSAWLMVRFMRFPVFDFVDARREKRVKFLVTGIVLITTIPSCYYAYSLVNRQVFESKAEAFITEQFNFEDTFVMQQRINSQSEPRSIEIVLVGEPLDDKLKGHIQANLRDRGLGDVFLNIKHGSRENNNELSTQELRSQFFQDIYQRNLAELTKKDSKIDSLSAELYRMNSSTLPLRDIANEAKAAYPGLQNMTMNRSLCFTKDDSPPDTAIVALVSFDRTLGEDEEERLNKWIKVRTKMDSVILVVQ